MLLLLLLLPLAAFASVTVYVVNNVSMLTSGHSVTVALDPPFRANVGECGDYVTCRVADEYTWEYARYCIVLQSFPGSSAFDGITFVATEWGMAPRDLTVSVKVVRDSVCLLRREQRVWEKEYGL
jgi:hypothetical protein